MFTRCVIQSSSLRLELSSLGARICSLKYLPIQGGLEIHEHYPTDDSYLEKRKYTGAIIGPVANRISQSHFLVNQKSYTFDSNEGSSLLHSGEKGLHMQIWEIVTQTQEKVIFKVSLDSKDDGFPGKRIFVVTYQIIDGMLSIEYKVETTEDCPINLTTHGYFNLDGTHDLSNHSFQIKADQFLPLDKNKIPTGEIHSVLNTKFDLNKLNALETIYDHHFIKRSTEANQYFAKAKSNLTGLVMTCKCSQAGMQFYTGNGRFFCFEPQANPDSMANTHFPNIILKKGKSYKERVFYSFTK